MMDGISPGWLLLHRVAKDVHVRTALGSEMPRYVRSFCNCDGDAFISEAYKLGTQ